MLLHIKLEIIWIVFPFIGCRSVQITRVFQIKWISIRILHFNLHSSLFWFIFHIITDSELCGVGWVSKCNESQAICIIIPSININGRKKEIGRDTMLNMNWYICWKYKNEIKICFLSVSLLLTFTKNPYFVVKFFRFHFEFVYCGPFSYDVADRTSHSWKIIFIFTGCFHKVSHWYWFFKRIYTKKNKTKEKFKTVAKAIFYISSILLVSLTKIKIKKNKKSLNKNRTSNMANLLSLHTVFYCVNYQEWKRNLFDPWLQLTCDYKNNKF